MTRLRAVAAPLLAALLAVTVPPRLARAWLERGASALSHGAREAEREVALGAAAWGAVDEADFDTGTPLFDREWAFGTPMMRTACLAQVARRHPSLAGELGLPLERAVTALLAPSARAFSRERWGSDPLAEDVLTHDHAAYLGYAGLALGLASTADARWTAPRREVAARARARLAQAPDRWLRTYPGEVYPVDVASVLGAVALDAALDGRSLAGDEPYRRALARVRAARDPVTGLLWQRLDPETGATRDGPRGSGTFLAAYFLLPADAELARALFDAGRSTLAGTTLGFAAMRERPRGDPGGGDVDSGPVIAGYGVSSTGFAMGAARAFGDHDAFAGLHATAELFGAPTRAANGGRRHLAGGPLGDAILCAMQTAASPAELAAWTEGAR